jgi:hypothetical protein
MGFFAVKTRPFLGLRGTVQLQKVFFAFSGTKKENRSLFLDEHFSGSARKVIAAKRAFWH